MFSKLRRFFKYDVWTSSYSSKKTLRNFFLKTLKTILITVKVSGSKEVGKGASLLTYYALLTVVPVLVFFFRLSQGFLSGFNLNAWLIAKFPQYTDQLNALSETASSSPGREGAATMLVGSFLIFCWAGTGILMTIEEGMNKIWESHSMIKSFKRIGIYILVILLSPAIFLLSSGSFVYLTKVLPLTWPRILNLNTSIIIFYTLSYLFPYLIICLLLSFTYLFMPQAEVKASPAFSSGFIIGSLYYILQAWYFSFQIKIFDYNFTYGALSSLPVLIVWIYLCWYLFLIGGSLTFALQYRDTYSRPLEKSKEGAFFATIACSFILNACSQAFSLGKPAPTANELSKKLKISTFETKKYLSLLVRKNFLYEITSLKGTRYQPSSPLEKVTIMTLFNILIKNDDKPCFSPLVTTGQIEKSLKEILDSCKSSSSNLLIKDIQSEC